MAYMTIAPFQKRRRGSPPPLSNPARLAHLQTLLLNCNDIDLINCAITSGANGTDDLIDLLEFARELTRSKLAYYNYINIQMTHVQFNQHTQEIDFWTDNNNAGRVHPRFGQWCEINVRAHCKRLIMLAVHQRRDIQKTGEGILAGRMQQRKAGGLA